MNRTLIPTLLAPLILASCTSATEPVADISASVVQHVVVRNVDGSVGRVEATFRLAISNLSGDPVYYSGCTVSLERQDAGLRWNYVWSPGCLLILPRTPLDGTVMIPEGGSREVSVAMSAQGIDQEWPSVGLEGTYRLRLHLLSRQTAVWRGTTGIQYKSHAITTNEFTLASAPN